MHGSSEYVDMLPTGQRSCNDQREAQLSATVELNIQHAGGGVEHEPPNHEMNRGANFDTSAL